MIPGFLGGGTIKWAAIAATVIAVIGLILRTLSGVKRAERDRLTVETFQKEQSNARKARQAGNAAAEDARSLSDDDLDDRLRRAGL